MKDPFIMLSDSRMEEEVLLKVPNGSGPERGKRLVPCLCVYPSRGPVGFP